MMNQRVIGVVENMSHLVTTCPHCGEIHTHHVFGKGGGADVARVLSTRLGYPVSLLAQIPLDPELRASGDAGVPIVEADPDQPAALPSAHWPTYSSSAAAGCSASSSA